MFKGLTTSVSRGLRRHRLWIIAVVMASAVAVAVSACGGSSTTTKSTGGSSDSTTSTGGSGGPSGSTITIGTTVSLTGEEASFPQVASGEQAAVDEINANGGINGNKLKLIVCDGKFTASGELDCFRSLIADKVTAIVGPVLLASTGVTEYDLAQQAGIPVVGSPAWQPGEMVSADAFPLGTSVVGTAYGAIGALIAHGAKRISLFGDANNPAANSIVTLGGQALKAAGMSPVNNVVGDAQTDPTFQSAAAKVVSGGTDGIMIAGQPSSLEKSVPAIRAQGYKGLIATVDGVLPAPVVKALGSAGNGILVASQTAFPDQTSNAGVRQFVADMKKYEPSASVDFFSIQAWSAVKLFAAVAGQAKATTAAQTLAAFKNLSKPVNVDTIAPYKVMGVTSPITSGYSPAPRMFNQEVQLGALQNGQFKASGGFIDPFTSLGK